MDITINFIDFNKKYYIWKSDYIYTYLMELT